MLIAMVLPFTPVGRWFGFVSPPLTVVASLAGLTIAYLVMAEMLKAFLFDHRACSITGLARFIAGSGVVDYGLSG